MSSKEEEKTSIIYKQEKTNINDEELSEDDENYYSDSETDSSYNSSTSESNPDKGTIRNAFQGMNRNEIKNLIIPRSVKQIENEAFRSCVNIETIQIPKTCVEICERAFLGCEGCTKLVIPDSVKVIGKGAFSLMSNLKHITLPPSLKVIDSYMFQGCVKLEEVVCDNVCTIRKSAFANCGLLKTMVLPVVGDILIEEGAFLGCPNFDV